MGDGSGISSKTELVMVSMIVLYLSMAEEDVVAVGKVGLESENTGELRRMSENMSQSMF
jgi:hypothetical protein